jgi:hypothetical protein
MQIEILLSLVVTGLYFSRDLCIFAGFVREALIIFILDNLVKGR